MIRYGDRLYIQHMSGAYISASSRQPSSPFTAQMHPMGPSVDPVKIQLLGRADGEIEEGAVVRIQSTESQLGDRTVLEV
ncbi:MAG: hypothetical protein F6K35_33160, partial [Okeania sp. SIO2H7]|nr:hypothetical protein [Okeania sp. SIO2H7]